MKTYGRRQAEESEFLLPLVLLGSLVKRGVARAWAVLWFPAGWVLRSLEQRRKNFLANTSVEQRVRLFRLLLASHFLMGALSAAALHWTQLSAALLLATPLFLFALCCFALLRSTPGVLAFLSTLAFVACLPAILHTVPFLVAAVTPLLRLASSHLPILLLPLAPFSGPVRPPAPVEPYQRPSGLPLHRPTDPHALSDEAVSSLIPLDSPLMTDKNKRQQDEPEQLDIVHPQQDNFIFEHAQGKNQEDAEDAEEEMAPLPSLVNGSRTHIDCDPILGCEAIVEKNESPTVVILGGGQLCAGSDDAAEIRFRLTGRGPWRVSYYEVGTTLQYNISGIASSPHAVNATIASHRLSVGHHSFRLGVPPPITSAAHDYLHSLKPHSRVPVRTIRDKYCPAVSLEGRATIRVHPLPPLPSWSAHSPACPGGASPATISFPLHEAREGSQTLEIISTPLSPSSHASLAAPFSAPLWNLTFVGYSHTLDLPSDHRHCISRIISSFGCVRLLGPSCFTLPVLSAPDLEISPALLIRSVPDPRLTRYQFCSGAPRLEDRSLSLVLSGIGPWTLSYLFQNETRTIHSDLPRILLFEPGHYQLVELADSRCTRPMLLPPFVLESYDNAAALEWTTTCMGDNLFIRFHGDSGPWTASVSTPAGPLEYVNVHQDVTISTRHHPNQLARYALTSASNARCPAVLSPASQVVFHPRPTSTIELVDFDIPNLTASLRLNLTGQAPWAVSVDGPETFSLAQVDTSPLRIPVHREGTYRVHDLADAVCHSSPRDLVGTATLRWPIAPTLGLAPQRLAHCDAEVEVAGQRPDHEVAFKFTGTPPFAFDLVHDGRLFQRFEGLMQARHRYQLPSSIPGGMYAVSNFRDRFYNVSDEDIEQSFVLDLMPLPRISWQLADNLTISCDQHPLRSPLQRALLLEGTPPFSFTLTRSSPSGDTVEHNQSFTRVAGPSLEVPITQPGLYRITEFRDSSNCPRHELPAPLLIEVLGMPWCHWHHRIRCPLSPQRGQQLRCSGGQPPYHVVVEISCQSEVLSEPTSLHVNQSDSWAVITDLIDAPGYRGDSNCQVTIRSVEDSLGCLIGGSDLPSRKPISYLVPAPTNATIADKTDQQTCDPLDAFELQVVLLGLESNGPWSLQFEVEDGQPLEVPVSLLGSSSHSISTEGRHRLSGVRDRHGCVTPVADQAVNLSRFRPLMAWFDGPNTDGSSSEVRVCSTELPLLLSVALSGEAPWTLEYADGERSTTVSDIQTPRYALEVFSAGTFRLLHASDAHCQGRTTDSHIRVEVIPVPTSQIYGGGVICDDGSVSTIQMQLTGTAPWSLVIHSVEGNELAFSKIWDDHFEFETSEAGTYYVHSIQDAFCHYTRPDASLSCHPED